MQEKRRRIIDIDLLSDTSSPTPLNPKLKEEPESDEGEIILVGEHVEDIEVSNVQDQDDDKGLSDSDVSDLGQEDIDASKDIGDIGDDDDADDNDHPPESSIGDAKIDESLIKDRETLGKTKDSVRAEVLPECLVGT